MPTKKGHGSLARIDYYVPNQPLGYPMNINTKALAHAEAQCAKHGSKLTQKRKAVLLGLLQANRAISAYELADYCKEKLDESLPIMSVYRILEFLEGEQLVHKLKLANRFVACSHIMCKHKHAVPQFLICEECYKVSELDISPTAMRSLHIKIKDAGFKLISPQLELSCVCDDCGAQEH